MTAKAIRWERRPDERPNEILDAALAVFAERGYRNTRLEHVGDAAGVSKGTIYHYFTNKEELLLRAIEHRREEAFGRIDELLRDKTAPVSTRLRLLVRRWFSDMTKERRAIVTLLVQGIAHEAPSAHRKWLAGGPTAAARVIAALIREGQTGGEFRRDADVDVAARMLVSGLLQQTVWQQYREDTPGLAVAQDRLVDSALELFLHSLRPTASAALRLRR
ncbi:MAG TPA: TetR/AcrR family transcriptional regulator [Gemmatimonadaceae bacterium]|nr:TetR/AcrR family transcriptional regulator [Gemmatimonadaceae bacterium]